MKISKTLSKPSRALQARLLSGLDIAAFWLSPLAILAVVFLTLIAAVRFGEHRARLRALAADGVETWGIWQGLSSDGHLALVEFDRDEHGLTGIVLDTQYYSPETLAARQVGERVRVRYTYPPAHEAEGVLAAAFPQVQAYIGHLTGLFWPFLLSWLIVVAHPEWLYMGFNGAFEARPEGESGR